MSKPRPDEEEKAADVSALSLENFIREQSLKEGDKLLPERELAVALGISRRSLRQILARMEIQGRVWRGKRSGTFLGKQPPSPGFSVDRSLERASPVNIMECRLLLEPAVAGYAALNATESDLAKIENSMRRTAEVTSDADWTHWDGAFHSAIAEATGNGVVEALVLAFNLARTKPDWSASRVLSVTPELRRQEVAHHRLIADAIRRRDMVGASQAMRQHLTRVRDDLASLFA